MKKILLATVMGLALLVSGMVSIAAAADLKIGFVDIDKAANDSEEGKKAITGLKDYMSSKQATINEKGKNIEKMKADLEKQAAVISPDAKKSRLEEIERSERDFQRMLSDVNLELEKKRRELTESIYKEIIEVVDKVGQEGKYDAILPVQSTLYGNKSLDLTDMIIKRYNELKAAKPAPKKK
ncbi:MAG TPA: OmpH family outer membrane protein [Dissulfurispiraceae bacterium]